MPAAPDEYNKFEVSGKTVYINKRVKSLNSGLKFHLRKVFFMRNIVVDGLRLPGF